MIEIGRVCVKLAGRDAGKKCVVVDLVDENIVLIDGFTRRRKCNLRHLEPLEQVIEIKNGASSEEVYSAFNIEKKAKKESQKSKKPAARKKQAKVHKQEAQPAKSPKASVPANVPKPVKLTKSATAKPAKQE